MTRIPGCQGDISDSLLRMPHGVPRIRRVAGWGPSMGPILTQLPPLPSEGVWGLSEGARSLSTLLCFVTMELLTAFRGNLSFLSILPVPQSPCFVLPFFSTSDHLILDLIESPPFSPLQFLPFALRLKDLNSSVSSLSTPPSSPLPAAPSSPPAAPAPQVPCLWVQGHPPLAATDRRPHFFKGDITK